MSAAATPRVHSLTRRLDRAPDAPALFAALTDGGRHAHTVLLESAEPDARKSQHSILLVRSALRVCAGDEGATLTALTPGGSRLLGRLQEAFGGARREGDTLYAPLPTAASPYLEARQRLLQACVFDVLRTVREVAGVADAQLKETVFLTGIFSFDLIDRYETLPPRPAGADFPDYVFYLGEDLLVVDHQHRRTRVVVNVFDTNADDFDAMERLQALYRAAAEAPASGGIAGRTGAGNSAAAQAITDMDDTAYAGVVHRLKQHIHDGDVFQVVPSRSFRLPCPDPYAAYRALRARNPSPYLFYLNDRDFTLFGASPESALKVDGTSGQVEIAPIAGTRARGRDAGGQADPELDARLEAELRTDSKELAEHMMLVDLARNDVARISEPGSREVVELLRVDRYAHVMHLVSRVRGQLLGGLDALHAYQASMNMGTLTGAPKLEACHLLRVTEATSRGPYGGAVGYLDADGSLDTAIVIRSALVRDGIAEVRAGAGVVHDSVPEREADETRRKAAAVLDAIASAGGGA